MISLKICSKNQDWSYICNVLGEVIIPSAISNEAPTVSSITKNIRRKTGVIFSYHQISSNTSRLKILFKIHWQKYLSFQDRLSFRRTSIHISQMMSKYLDKSWKDIGVMDKKGQKDPHQFTGKSNQGNDYWVAGSYTYFYKEREMGETL